MEPGVAALNGAMGFATHLPAFEAAHGGPGKAFVCVQAFGFEEAGDAAKGATALGEAFVAALEGYEAPLGPRHLLFEDGELAG
ncbi:MAG: hypothetical protein EXR47_08250 [Dehalococcoidia bacterium]|nr:hypothetical protein [Dehalococcoidia bacterium]